MSAQPDFDQPVDDLSSFTSWKMDLINALLVDPRLKPSDFKVAVAVLQFMNSETGMTFPAQETIAEIVHMTPRNVGKCLARIKLAGWIRWGRDNRQKTNMYEFDTKNVGAMLDYRTSLDDGRRERLRARRGSNSGKNGGSAQKAADRNKRSFPHRNGSSSRE